MVEVYVFLSLYCKQFFFYTFITNVMRIWSLLLLLLLLLLSALYRLTSRTAPTFLKELAAFNRLPDSALLVTLDVTSLHTNIPHNEGIDACRYFLQNRTDKTYPYGPEGRYSPISAIQVCAAPKGMVFEPFWSENGYRFWPLWSEIGYGFQRKQRERINVFVFSTPNE